jgi:two-component system OmpR family sensor kinase
MGEPAAPPALSRRPGRPAMKRRARLTRRPAITVRRPRRPQLRTRVLAGVVAVTLIALAAFDFAAVSVFRKYLVGHTDARLGTVLNLYRPGWVAAPPPGRKIIAAPPHLVISGPRAKLPPPLSGVSVAFLPGRGPRRTFVRGGPILKSWVPARLQAVAARGAQTVINPDGNAQLRVRAVRLGGPGGGILFATTSLGDVNGSVGQLEAILAVGSLAAGLLVAVGVALIMRRGLRPIEAMATEADRINAGDLADRVSQQDPASEVGRLGAALNGMLARIEAAIAEREASQELTRRFFADASHELRNPLASLRANAELYQQGVLRERSQVDEAMRRIALEAQRMSGLVDDMLRLARLDHHPCQQADPVDVTALVADCTERARLADPSRAWRPDIAAGLVVTGDEELLRRAVDNLLANVRAHTPAGTVATIAAARRGGTVTIEVTDDGPGVPAEQIPRIFDRFYRAGAPARRPGSGLGLAIVTAIAATHDGTATAAAGQPHGLRITLDLPACRESRPGEPAAGTAGQPALV